MRDYDLTHKRKSFRVGYFCLDCDLLIYNPEPVYVETRIKLAEIQVERGIAEAAKYQKELKGLKPLNISTDEEEEDEETEEEYNLWKYGTPYKPKDAKD